MNRTSRCGGRALPALVPSLLLLTFSCGHEAVHKTLIGESAPAPAASKQPILFTAIPDRNATELIEKYRLVSDHLALQLGVPFEYVPTVDYNASVQLFRSGDVQLAWFGGLTGVQAAEFVPGSRMIAQGKVDPAFKSYFVVHESVMIDKSDTFPMGLQGLKFTFGSEQSTSGRLMPEYFIRQNTKLSPQEFFGLANAYSGSHDKTALLVEAGTFQAGALNYRTYDDMVAAGKLDPAKCKIVWVTPTYPDYNFTAHPLLDQRHGKDFTDRLQTTLVNITDPVLLEALQRQEGLIPANSEDWESIRQVAAELGFLQP
jgi:phosphonate transport system substrate-binding protein